MAKEIDSDDIDALREELEKNFVLMKIPDCDQQYIGEVPGAIATIRITGQTDKLYLAIKVGKSWFRTTDPLVEM